MIYESVTQSIRQVFWSVQGRYGYGAVQYIDIILLTSADFPRVCTVAYIQSVRSAADSSWHPLFGSVSVEICWWWKV